jgi:glycine/D-amino acid oxidase-like deaminating enzyme
MDTLSYWADTCPAEKSYRDNPLPESVDVAVVGSGYTGLSAALHLAKSGASVAVLERETLGWGASSRNGGMLLPGLKHGVDHLIRHYGYEAACQMLAWSLDSIDLVRRLIAEDGIDCDYQDVGYFYAAWKPGHLAAIETERRLMAERFDYPTTLIPAERSREEVGTARYHGGLVDPCGGGLHPAKFVAGLARAAERAGASLHEGAEAQSIRRASGGFEVATARGTLRAGDVMIGTNGYTGPLTPWLRRRIIPLGSYIIVTEPLDPTLADRLIPHRRMIFDSKNILYYFRILPDQRMLFGGRVSFTPTTSEVSGARLRAEMVALFPELARVRVDYSWGGYLGLAFDQMPHAGQQDGLWYAVAYAGHGVSMATWLGARVAMRLSGQSAELPFADIPFPSMFLYGGRPWFLPLVGAWFRLMDCVS